MGPLVGLPQRPQGPQPRTQAERFGDAGQADRFLEWSLVGQCQSKTHPIASSSVLPRFALRGEADCGVDELVGCQILRVRSGFTGCWRPVKIGTTMLITRWTRAMSKLRRVRSGPFPTMPSFRCWVALKSAWPSV